MPMIQQTVEYTTYIKNTMVGAMAAVFANHPDTLLSQHTRVTIEMPMERAAYPSVVVRFYERDIPNAGVGHQEWIELVDENTLDPTGQFVRYRHRMYHGDIEFAIYALSSIDRDLVGDSVVQTLSMADTEGYSKIFIDRIYAPDLNLDPESIQHFINLNTDNLSGYGESEVIAPWLPEDVMVYQKSYRLPIFGEFYSRTPAEGPVGKIERVDQYPYDGYVGEPMPNPNPGDPGIWFGEGNELF